MSKNKDVSPVHLRSATAEGRARERRDKSNLCKINVTVRKQTAYHLQQMARCTGSNDLGRIVDKLVRDHQLSLRVNMMESDFYND